jgi:hypothetical protein
VTPSLDSFFQISNRKLQTKQSQSRSRKEMQIKQESTSNELLALDVEHNDNDKDSTNENGHILSEEGDAVRNSVGKVVESTHAQEMNVVQTNGTTTNYDTNKGAAESLDLLPPPEQSGVTVTTTTVTNHSNLVSSASSAHPSMLLNQIGSLVQDHVQQQLDDMKRAHLKEIEAIRSLHNAKIVEMEGTTANLNNQVKALQQKQADKIPTLEKVRIDLTIQIKSLQRQSASLQSALGKVRSSHRMEKQKNSRFKELGVEINEIGHVIFKPPGFGGGGGGLRLDSQSQRSDVDLRWEGSLATSGNRNPAVEGGNSEGRDESPGNSDAERSQESDVTKVAQDDGDNLVNDSGSINAVAKHRKDNIGALAVGTAHSVEASHCQTSKGDSERMQKKIVPTEPQTTQSPVLSTSNSSPTVSKELQQRSSIRDMDITVSLPPKRLNFQSAIANASPRIKQEHSSPLSADALQFSIEVDCDDDSSDDETRMNSSQNSVDQEHGNDASPLVPTKLRKVTPAASGRDDHVLKQNKPLNGRNKIPIRDVSNQTIKMKEEKLSPAKRRSPTAWLGTEEEAMNRSNKTKRRCKPSSSIVGVTATSLTNTRSTSSNRAFSRGSPRPFDSTVQPSTTRARTNNPKNQNTSANEYNYKYKEVVRGKKEREKLHGNDCECCKGFYDALLSGKGAQVFDRDKMVQENSRHRSRHVEVENTPKDFWEMSFMDSIEERKTAALEQEQKEVQDDEMEKEWMSTGKEDGEEENGGDSQSQTQSPRLSQASVVEQSIVY